MNKKDYYWAKYMLIFGFFCISFGTSIFLKTEHAPDEAMRMLIPEYIVSHHTLPNGMEESVRHPLWGFSYALYPYLTAIISSVFMAITSLFTKSAAALLTAARLTSVLSGTGTLIVVFLIGEELFERRESALLGGIFVGFLPQFVFLSCYVNNDSFAVFTVALIIYFWIRGMKSAFCKKDCIGLGAGCGLCAETGKGDLRQSSSGLCHRLPDRRLVLHPQCRHPRRRPARHAHHKGIRIAVCH